MVQEIHFVTGKGGVGKSLMAAALAHQKAESGQKTLLVELGDQSYFAHFFGLDKVSYEPKNIQQNLDIAIWNGSESLREYARYLLKIETLFQLFFENPVTRSLVNVAPGLPELAVLGKITSDPRKHGPSMSYDCIVVDAFATGHFLSLLRAPRGMAQAVRFGPMGEQSRSIDEWLFRKNLCHFHVVTLAEELPIQETIELCETLKTEFQIEPLVIVNKIVKTFLTSKNLESLSDESNPQNFLTFLKGQIQRFEVAMSQLKKHKMIPRIVSLKNETQSWPLVRQIQEELL